MQLSSADLVLWNRINPAIAYMRTGGISVGAAAFISKDGLAITHQLTISRTPADLQTSSGQVLKFKVLHKDTPSQLVLIKTEEVPKGISTVEPATNTDGTKGFIYAVLAHGPCKAELTNAGTIGIDEASRRSVPMSVVRIEQTISPIGGGLLLNERGRLVGAFAATLATSNQSRSAAVPSGRQNDSSHGEVGVAKALPGGSPLPVNGLQSSQYQNLGPQGMVVGYSPTWEVMTKALNGFKTPSHKASQGLLGIFVVDSPESGGLAVKEFFVDSPALSAGIELGDVIVRIGDFPVKNQIDFARATYRLVPNTNVVVVVKRGNVLKNVLVTVGSQLTALREGLALSIAM